MVGMNNGFEMEIYGRRTHSFGCFWIGCICLLCLGARLSSTYLLCLSLTTLSLFVTFKCSMIIDFINT